MDVRGVSAHDREPHTQYYCRVWKSARANTFMRCAFTFGLDFMLYIVDIMPGTQLDARERRDVGRRRTADDDDVDVENCANQLATRSPGGLH